jgi:hypothetical protein
VAQQLELIPNMHQLSPGRDLNGNLMASLMYSVHFGLDNTSIEEVQEWNMFVGDDITMLKVCNPAR